MADAQTLKNIESKILAFKSGSLKQNTLNLFNALGYESPHQMDIFENTPEGFLEYLKDNDRTINQNQAYFSEWKTIDFCLQLTNEESGLFESQVINFDGNLKSYYLFCIELNEKHYTNRALADITRAMNRVFANPVFVLLKHGNSLTLSIINRRKNKKDSSKEVLEKITLIKDIDVSEPHRAHKEILFDLSLFELRRNFTIHNFDDLHSSWQSVLNISELNKKFYREISNWYFWAMDNVEFPKDAGEEKDVRNATSLIRLLTRLLFVWFLKEKNLVPEELFNKKFIDEVLNYKDKTGSTYYKAVLQNLFFATLNTQMKKDNLKSRVFIEEATSKGFVNDGYLQSGYFRYKRFMKSPEQLIDKYSSIPFLNGGLFECLDDKVEGKEIRIDCFSNEPKNETLLKVPDELFFGKEQKVDLNKIYDTKNKDYKTRGLINILNNYKFTIAENTPVEEEVALDPELLGKVFESLLASYNPETLTTARKATGSFYTPREIVNYMVDESIIAYLNNKQKEKNTETDFEDSLRQLLAYTDESHKFNNSEIEILLNAIENIKILDPACGSGAFPMGVLHKLVYILQKLDPENRIWKQKLIDRTPSEIREETRKALDNKPLEYVRKLGLIENCIYGVDIQPIAIQITKLRFFISLIVEQKIDDTKENRDIKSLPNLETKFVAANTLIGLDKPKDTLASEVAEIKNAEEKLLSIRKDIFYVNSSKKKKDLAQKEKEARENLKKLLESKGGFGHGTAEQIAAWDPFNLNAKSDWFDPEFMFGISGGFDIVIGNPPYVVSNDKILRNIYKESVYGRPNLYGYFIHATIQKFLNMTGHLTFINPRTILTDSYFSALRKFIIKNASIKTVLNIIDRRNVFESVLQSCIVNIFSKIKLDSVKVKNIERKQDIIFQEYLSVKKDSFIVDVDGDPIFIVADNQISYAILDKIFQLNSFQKKSLIFTTGKIQWDLYKDYLSDNPNKSSTHLIWAENIQRFEYQQPRTRADKVYINTKLTTCKPINKSTIVVQRTTAVEQEYRIIANFIEPSKFGYPIQCENNTSYLEQNSGNYDLLFILGLLNSRLFDFIFRLINSNTHVSAGELNIMPFPETNLNYQNQIISVVEKIILLKQGFEKSEILEKRMNILVFKLYDLTYDEVKIVDPEYALTAEEYEKFELEG